MTREPDSTDFDDIVASWRAEGGVPEWPREDAPFGDRGRRTGVDEPPPPRAGDSPAGGDPAGEPAGPAEPQPPGGAPDPRTPGGAPDPRTAGGAPDPRTPGGPSDPRPPGGAPDLPPRSGAADPRPPGGADPPTAGLADADEHFVPPEPPPLPRVGPPMLVGLTLIGLGLVLVTFPGWVGVPQVYGLPLGLVGIAAGLGWLVLRLWPDSAEGGAPPLYLDDPDDPDGGAVL